MLCLSNSSIFILCNMARYTFKRVTYSQSDWVKDMIQKAFSDGYNYAQREYQRMYSDDDEGGSTGGGILKGTLVGLGTAAAGFYGAKKGMFGNKARVWAGTQYAKAGAKLGSTGMIHSGMKDAATGQYKINNSIGSYTRFNMDANNAKDWNKVKQGLMNDTKVTVGGTETTLRGATTNLNKEAATAAANAKAAANNTNAAANTTNANAQVQQQALPPSTQS